MKFQKTFIEALDIGNEILALASLEDFELLHLNERFQKTFDQVSVGKNVFDVFPIENRDRAIKAINKRGRFKAFYEPKENNSFQKTYEIQFLVRHLEEQSILLLSISDASYKKELDSLSLVIKDLGDQKEVLEKAYDEAKKLAAAKSDFLANMSHELRTPMNGVLGMIDLLKDTDLDQGQKDMINTIGQCSEGLLVILNDILDLSKMGSNEFKLDNAQFSVWDLCSHIIQLSQFLKDDKDIEIKLNIAPDTPKNLLGDKNRIRQILTNLLSNAIKFTQKGFVELSVEVLKKENNRVLLQFSVVDTGIGISEEKQKNIFDPFTQAEDSRTKLAQGTGLGLSISKKLVEVMQGEIKMSSKLNHGTRMDVEIELPVIESSLQLIDSSRLESVEDRNEKLVLVVEDNVINQMVAQKFLEKLGYEADLASDGFEAVAILEDKPEGFYSLIFMDMQMPKMDGLEASKKILTILGDKAPNIIAFTANTFSDDREMCLKAGMKDVLVKPVLIDKMDELLKKYAA